MTNIAQLIESMSEFASNTKNDNLSVMVSRVANRLVHQEALFERPLTKDEMKIVNTFEAKLAGKLKT